MKAPEPEDVKGKHKDTMKGMFDTKAKDSESFHNELMRSLDDNKRKYDRQLYSDWLIKVYERCTNICVKAPTDEDINRSTRLNFVQDNQTSYLREVEKQCARNCMRKFDRAYKTFDQLEKRIFDDFIADEKIDPSEVMKALARQEEERSNRDLEEGSKLVA
jgi:hypothetical protein